MKYLFVLSFIIVFCVFSPQQCGYSAAAPLYTHFTYIFSHATVIHLLLNSFCFVSLWIALQRSIKKQTHIIVPVIVIAVACSFIPICNFERVTVGASGVCYAMLGMLIVCRILPFTLSRIRAFAPLFASIIIVLAFSFFLKNSNFWLHLFCLLGGIIFYITRKKTL